jgi:hypothetical protein
VAIQTTYIPHAHVFKVLEDEWRDVQTLVEWNI